MADTSNLTSFLGDIANAIRTKKETTEEIPAANFDTEILSIEGGTDTSDATATADDILSPKTAYVNNKKVTGAMNALTSDNSVPVFDTSNIANNTGYSILDIDNSLKLAILKVSNSQIKICKIINNEISTENCVTISNSDLVTVENQNILMDAKFMYYDDTDSDIGISAVVYTDYRNWVSKYAGVIQYINKTTLELKTKITATAEIPTDGVTPNGLVLPRPLNKNCFAYYGFFNTNGKQHCLITYYISNGELVTNTLFTTNYESHGTNRFGCWVPDGKLLYVTDLYSTYYVYSVSDDNATWTRKYTNSIVPLTSSIGIKSGNTIVDLTTDNTIGTIDFTLNNLNYKWMVNDSYLYMYDASNVYVYNIDSVITKSIVYNMSVNKLFRTNTIYFVTSTIVKFISAIEKNIYCITRKGKDFWDTLDTTATTNDLLETKTAYITGSKKSGTMPNNGELNYTPSSNVQTIPAGYTSGGTISAADITALNDYKTCLGLTKIVLGESVLNPISNGLLLNLTSEESNVLNSNGVIWSDLMNNKKISINNATVNSDFSIEFNGSNTYFDSKIAQGSLTDGYTIAVRIKPATWDNYKGVYGLHGGGYNGIVGLQYENGNLSVANIGASSPIKIPYSNVPTDTWSTVIIVYSSDGSGLAYINGELNSNTTGFGTLSPYGNLIFGKAYDTSDRYFKGSMSHCIVYNRSLTEEEILSLNSYIIGGAE